MSQTETGNDGRNYLVMEYKNSIPFNAVEYNNELYQLQNRRPYAESAVDFHQRNNTPKNAAFFQAHLEHIDARIAKITPPGAGESETK